MRMDKITPENLPDSKFVCVPIPIRMKETEHTSNEIEQFIIEVWDGRKWVDFYAIITPKQ